MTPFADPVIDALARHVAHGMAIAEATTWSGLFHRAQLLPFWTRRKRREIEHDHDLGGGIDVPLPFALNQPSLPLLAAPGPRSEWLVFQFGLLAAGGARYDREAALDAWRSLSAVDPPPRLSLSQHAAVEALTAGGLPPTSGHDHPHYFDDAATVRAVALAVALSGDRDGLIRAVQDDAGITNAEDGIWSAVAIATAIAAILRGGDVAVAIDAAVDGLPAGTWIAERTAYAGRIARGVTDPLELGLALERHLSNAAYSYGDAAPDVLPLVFAILRALHPRPEAALLAASCIPRHALAVVPLLGAMLAVVHRPAATTRSIWPTRAACAHVPALLGLALPALAGIRLDPEATWAPPPTSERRD